jgi:2-(1,2-epoxy-1,2-dihydrophenyl)acetyl-CoA isomerase
MPTAEATARAIETELADGVLRIRLAKPEKMNALSEADMDALAEALASAAVDANVRCLLLTGLGRAFCAGRDISSAGAGEDAGLILRRHVNPMLLALHRLPQPTIAAVNGAAMGVGLGLALACDIVYVGESAKFSSPFARLGAALDSGGHYFLPRRVSPGRAMELIYTGDVIDGAEAVRLGLADRLAPDGVLQASAAALARRIADGPQSAFQAQKALMRNAASLSLSEVLEREAKIQGDLARTPEYAEGIAAFQARRPPRFREGAQ